MDRDVFILRYPTLYHMAEKGTWPSVKARGLLSTSAVLDLHKVTGAARTPYESQHRPVKVPVGTGDTAITLRDQKPMTPSRLASALTGGLTPTQWYELLNRKVFMWAREERLIGLLSAAEYGTLEHDVLTIDTLSLLEQHEQDIWLCHMNSGNTRPWAHKRNAGIFQRIAEYPARRNGNPVKEVVEVVVDYSVPDISAHVIAVRRMKGATLLKDLPL